MNKLIYDRNETDLINNTDKGQYTYTDLNRVETWCRYLADLLNDYGYTVSIATKTNWLETDYHYSEDMERIRSNINTLKQAYFSFTRIPENLEYMTYQKANDIEKILDEIEKILSYMENNFTCCGVADCGQSRLWQKRFRTRKDWLQFMDRTLNNYLDTDLLSMVATNNNKVIQGKTDGLKLIQIDDRDGVYESCKSINNSMAILDTLTGGAHEQHY